MPVNGGEPAGMGRALSPRQARVAQRLLAQVGPGPARFFRDACELVAQGPALPSVTHLVAHLLREVESAVRSILTRSWTTVGDQLGRTAFIWGLSPASPR